MAFLFKDELKVAILKGCKTQTRRPIKPGETLCRFYNEKCAEKSIVTTSNGKRRKHYVDQVNSVPYGYGKPTAWYNTESRVMLPFEQFPKYTLPSGEPDYTALEHNNYARFQIKIFCIDREDVRDISRRNAIAEGFEDERGFWRVWCDFYDKTADINNLRSRPDSKYQAWVYCFVLLPLDRYDEYQYHAEPVKQDPPGVYHYSA